MESDFVDEIGVVRGDINGGLVFNRPSEEEELGFVDEIDGVSEPGLLVIRNLLHYKFQIESKECGEEEGGTPLTIHRTHA